MKNTKILVIVLVVVILLFVLLGAFLFLRPRRPTNVAEDVWIYPKTDKPIQYVALRMAEKHYQGPNILVRFRLYSGQVIRKSFSK